MAKKRTPRLVVIGAFAVVAALVLVAVVVVSATGADVSDQEANQSITAGPAAPLRETIAEKGAVYYANPLGGAGFWLTIVDDQLVALAYEQPLDGETCDLDFDEDAQIFTACDQEVDPANLDRHPITIDDGKVSVDIRRVD